MVDIVINGFRVGDYVKTGPFAKPHKYRNCLFIVKKLTAKRAVVEIPGFPAGQYRYPNYWPVEMLTKVENGVAANILAARRFVQR